MSSGTEVRTRRREGGSRRDCWSGLQDVGYNALECREEGTKKSEDQTQ